MVTLINICSENDVPVTAACLKDYSPVAFAVLEEEIAGKHIVCREAGAAELFCRSSVSDSLSEGGTVPGFDKELYVIGDQSFISCFETEASRIVKFRLHAEDTDDAGAIFPIPGGEWRENGRELLWDALPGGGLHNCSVITYDRKPSSASAISVVVSAYNQPEWLEKTLWGYEAQEYKDFELIIADDGSGPATREMLARLRPQLSFPVKHVWHNDAGFRKCAILNKAILASRTDYLLFSDGDCIPRGDFVAAHMRERRRGRFMSNGYYKLDMRMSRLISKEDILAGRCFDIKWLKSHGLPHTFKNNKFTARGFKRKLLNALTPANASWNGHGASAWLADILAANGFDERMKYGGEDREFGERLENAGVRGKQIRYSTVCVHLDHSRGYVAPGDVERNDALRRNTRKFRVKRTPFGIYKEK